MNLQDQLRSARDAGDSQVTELRHMMEGMKAHHEFERKSLREALQQVSVTKLVFHSSVSSFILNLFFLCSFVHVCLHAHMHTLCMHPRTLTHLHTHAFTHIYTHTHTHSQMCMLTLTRT